MADSAAPLHLLVVGSAWPPETFIARLLRGLLQEGVHITVACAKKPKEEWTRLAGFHWLFAPNWEGNRILRLARLSIAFTRGLLANPQEFRDALAQLDTSVNRMERFQSWNRVLPFIGRKWDVIYFPWNSAAVSYLPLFHQRMPVVISCRGAQINIAPHNNQRQNYRTGLFSTFELAAAVHCVSHAILEEAIPFGLDPNKSVVIRPAVDTTFFKPRKSSIQQRPGKFRVITTGSLIWRKGYEYGLLAIRKIVDAGLAVEFIIIGGGPERARVLFTIDDLGISDRVRLLGKLSPEQVLDELQKSDVFLLSSLSEGISNAVLEAMACGLPVVTTDCGGMREAVTDGIEGFVVPVRNADGIAAALTRLASEL